MSVTLEYFMYDHKDDVRKFDIFYYEFGGYARLCTGIQANIENVEKATEGGRLLNLEFKTFNHGQVVWMLDSAYRHCSVTTGTPIGEMTLTQEESNPNYKIIYKIRITRVPWSQYRCIPLFSAGNNGIMVKNGSLLAKTPPNYFIYQAGIEGEPISFTFIDQNNNPIEKQFLSRDQIVSATDEQHVLADFDTIHMNRVIKEKWGIEEDLVDLSGFGEGFTSDALNDMMEKLGLGQ